jgi:pSer/pThr/pTyr-binding forkhead associated (FHA) protein
MSATTSPPAAGLHATDQVDALPYLSHRDRRRAVPWEDRPPGRYLLAQGGGREGVLLPLTGDVTHIGRGAGASLSFDDSTVSRRHAIIVRRAGTTRVLDDRSTNGVFVNGRRMTEAELHDGDVLVIGRLVLTYLEL